MVLESNSLDTVAYTIFLTNGQGQKLGGSWHRLNTYWLHGRRLEGQKVSPLNFQKFHFVTKKR